MVLLREELLRKSFPDFSRIKSSVHSSPDTSFKGFLPDVREYGLAADTLEQSYVIHNADPKNIGICGLDLRVSDKIFVSNTLRRIRTKNELFALEEAGEVKRVEPGADGTVLLEPDPQGQNVYFIQSEEHFDLPRDLDLWIDAKSTTGRVGVMCDNVFDNNRAIGLNPVIIAARPYAFPIKIHPGITSLVQAVLRYKNTPFMTADEVRADENVQASRGGREYSRFTEHGLPITYATDLALLAKPNTDPIDMSKRREYDVRDYFTIIEGNGQIKLEARQFALLGIQETVKLGNVRGVISREHPKSGTGFWGHFAGETIPGFHGPLTMECRSETARVVNQGDLAGFIQFDKLERELDESELYQGTYQHQTVPMAPKMFKPL